MVAVVAVAHCSSGKMFAMAHCSSGKMFAMAMAVGNLTGRCFHIVVVVVVVAVIGAVTHKMFGVDKHLFAAVVKSKMGCDSLGCGFVVAVVCFCLWFLLESYLN